MEHVTKHFCNNKDLNIPLSFDQITGSFEFRNSFNKESNEFLIRHITSSVAIVTWLAMFYEELSSSLHFDSLILQFFQCVLTARSAELISLRIFLFLIFFRDEFDNNVVEEERKNFSYFSMNLHALVKYFLSLTSP